MASNEWARLVRSAISAAAALPVATDHCAVCGRTTALGFRGPPLCGACLEELYSPQPRREVVLGTEDTSHPLSCVAGRPYRGMVPVLLEAYKRHGRRRLAATLATALLAEPLESLAAAHGEAMLLVPIPASRRGRRARGFDQVELLVRHLQAAHASLLVRRGSSVQKSLNRADRLASAAAGLSLRRTQLDRFEERRIVLVDDVVTTGATLLTAAAMLRAAGLTVVGAVALAIHE